MTEVTSPHGAVVGALACQKSSNLKALETTVISCVKYAPSKGTPNGISKKSKTPVTTAGSEQDTWLIECADSVLFPEGGGQPTDHGTITPLSSSDARPIPVTNIQRDGLHCIHSSPHPIPPGSKVRQAVDFARRWDHMQQHTGQHILSAVMERYENLETLGWSMGAASEMNYVELPRKPSEAEIAAIQMECNEKIRENIGITVETPDDVVGEKLPEDYDKEKGVVRVIRIGNLDANPCCGTHLQQTSHVSLILLHHTQPIRGTNTRLYFAAGDRAINMAATSINTLRLVGGQLSTGSSADQVLDAVKRIIDTSSEVRKREKKLLQEIAKYEGERVKRDLANGQDAWVYRPDGGLDYINMVVCEVKDALKELDRAVLLVSGEGKSGGPVVVLGGKNGVEKFVTRIKEVVTAIKGGGKGERWQGKVMEWRKGDLEALEKLNISK